MWRNSMRTQLCCHVSKNSTPRTQIPITAYVTPPAFAHINHTQNVARRSVPSRQTSQQFLGKALKQDFGALLNLKAVKTRSLMPHPHPHSLFAKGVTPSLAEYQDKIKKALQENKNHLDSLTHEGSQLKLTYDPDLGSHPPPLSTPESRIFFFDIDNCLYKRSTRIHDLMQTYIHEYFKQNLQVSEHDAEQLCLKYYHQYGLAIQGLVRFHQIDGIEYNEKVDDALPLQNILKPDPELRQLLLRLRATGKVERLWLFTNAYKNHAKRVIQLLGIADLFDGLTYCDYSQHDLVCKPDQKMFYKALQDANGGNSFRSHYFVDDSLANIVTSTQLGLKSIHFVERDEDLGKTPEGALLIRDILELPKVVPELFQ